MAKKKSHAHKKHSSGKKKKPATNYVFGVVVFIVLVAVVAGLIWLASKSGESRLVSMGKTAAIVNGEKITMDTIDEQYGNIPEMYKEFMTKEVIVNQTINEVILLQEAKKQGVSVTEQDVKDEIDDALEKSGMTEAELDKNLKEQNITKAYLTELYKKQLTINALLEKVVFPKLSVSQSEVKQFYDSRIRAMHILVDEEEEAEDIIEELKKSTLEDIESDFADLAEEKSKDPSAATNKGDLGEFSKGQMVSEFEDAAFALEEYAFTAEPIQTQFGYHVILRVPKNQTISEQASAIEELLLSQKKAAAVPLYIEQLRSKADIQVLYKEEATEASS